MFDKPKREPHRTTMQKLLEDTQEKALNNPGFFERLKKELKDGQNERPTRRTDGRGDAGDGRGIYNAGGKR